MEEVLECVDTDWTRVIDDLDRYQLSDNGTQIVPLSSMHRGAQDGLAAYSDLEEVKKEKCSVVVQIVPAFGLKELSVYADAEQLIQVGKKFTYEVDEELFEKIEVDETKCQNFRKDASQIKIGISYKANLETCEFDKHIQHLLDHLKGTAENLVFTTKNQFDFIYLCELFKVSILSGTVKVAQITLLLCFVNR